METFDPKKTTLVIGGRVITGYANDGMLTVAHNADKVVPHQGVQGDVAYAINADNSATMTLNLMSTSSSLGYIRALAGKAKLVGVTITDANEDGGIHVSAEDCVIMKIPDYTRRKEIQSTTVTVFIPHLVYPDVL